MVPPPSGENWLPPNPTALPTELAPLLPNELAPLLPNELAPLLPNELAPLLPNEVAPLLLNLEHTPTFVETFSKTFQVASGIKS